jgi:hypothetical protein
MPTYGYKDIREAPPSREGVKGRSKGTGGGEQA